MAKWNGSKWIRPNKRRAIYARDAHRCVYCQDGIEDGIILTLDHVTARELGGTNVASNLVTACKHCNSAKRHLTVRQFIVYLDDQGADTDGIARRVRNATRRIVRK